jgi:3-hydroxyisobutyrate dehydrogenase-like beta-hydroxyacid dehydrogenase
MTTRTESLAWIGIDKMGLSIGGRIAAAGYGVTAFDASNERRSLLRQTGSR